MIKKTTIILMVLFSAVICKERVFAQSHVLGVRGAYSIGMASFEPNKFTFMDMGNYEAALTYTYTGFQDYYGALQTELIYSQRGFSYELYEDSDEIYSRKIVSVEIPFLWRPYYTFSKDRGIVYGLLGMYVYYDISSRDKFTNRDDPEDDFNTPWTDWEYSSLSDNRLGIGVIGGAGFGWNIVKNLRLSVEGRYVYAFSNVFKPAAKWEGNPVQSSTSKIVISMGISYSINTKRK